MAIQSVVTDAPYPGSPGQITDVGNRCVTFSAPAADVIPVGKAIVRSAAIADPMAGMKGFTVTLPSLATDLFTGISVRVDGIPTNPVNDPTGWPYYPAESLVTYIVQGSIWVQAVSTIPDPAPNVLPPVYMVWETGGVGEPGDLIAALDHSVLIDRAYWASSGASGDMVKIILL